MSKAEHIDIEKLKTVLKEDEDPEIVDKKFSAKKGIQYGKGKNKKKKEDAYQIKYSGKIKEKKVMEYLMNCEFRMIK